MIKGSVLVDVNNAISMESGSGLESFTLIGHGGRNRSGTFGAVGDKVEVISRTAGLSMANGNGSQAFSMIGMGESSTTGSKTGDVVVHRERCQHEWNGGEWGASLFADRSRWIQLRAERL